ncbi:hypothetical protein [Prevotella sp. E2-28]|uniref:hypothetical protein n=1 Tax=Prevotella sp. E2-28 TaxID=2913620 RepID=UPI001EDC81D3|nr:hypothetical protein [Prevotella sp. E2-28]UKK54262.1 hypothetical protein L6465_03110 [Prevotella sp. E2-28]
MKKRLLFAFMAMSAAVSGYALEQGEFVYTHQGRFQITGANQNANSAFQDMTGWTVIGAGKTLADKFNTNADGYVAGINSIQSIDATAGEGMYYKFEPTDASATYVVSFKMKGAALDNIRVRVPGDGYKTSSNLVKVAGHEIADIDSVNGEVIANTAEELTESWQTFNYAIIGDGTTRTWYISFASMATTIEIADVQIAPAIQMADLRQRDAMLEKLIAYKDCYEWPAGLLSEFAIDEAITNLQAIGNESGQAELDEKLTTAQEILDEFLKSNMDDYLAGSKYNYLRNDYDGSLSGGKNLQKTSSYGDWTATTTGRAFWNINEYPDLGHYAGNTAWNFGNTADPMGVYTRKTLDPGSYVFGIQSKAAVREDPTSSSWTNNDGLNPAYGVAYIVKLIKENDSIVSVDTIVSQIKDLKSATFTSFLISAKIEEAGSYEIGFKAYCKDAYKDMKNGSVTYVANASILGKNDNKYNQKQLGYETDVREQITTGRTQLTTATENIANADYLWGKAELQACVDSVETKIAAYELLNQDAIIATYEDDYVKSTSAETGYLVYTIYQEAVKDIIAANKKFVAVNDTLASIQTAISAAEVVLGQRLYDAATGKADLQSAINTAKGVQTQMKADQYSEENAAAIVAAIATLNEAVETFKTTVPASAMTTIVDIDFEGAAVQNAETQLYSVAGAAGSMEFSNWSTDGTGNQPFEKGYWSNGEQLWAGYIRIGNGTGTVVFDPTVDGSMGTNILKVACDMYVQGLSGKSLGFFLKNVKDGAEGEEETEVFGLFRNFYNGTTEKNTCNVDVNMIWAKSGGSYNNASPADADEETLTANPLQKSHFEVILDYGTSKMYCTISSINGSTTSEEVALEAIPNKFVLQCNYNNNDRRAWFDNLKIERVAAGEATGISEVNAAAKVKAPTKVLKNGRIIINGKYAVNGMLVK